MLFNWSVITISVFPRKRVGQVLALGQETVQKKYYSLVQYTVAKETGHQPAFVGNKQGRKMLSVADMKDAKLLSTGSLSLPWNRIQLIECPEHSSQNWSFHLGQSCNGYAETVFLSVKTAGCLLKYAKTLA